MLCTHSYLFSDIRTHRPAVYEEHFLYLHKEGIVDLFGERIATLLWIEQSVQKRVLLFAFRSIGGFFLQQFLANRR